MACETTELERIESNLVEGMSIDYWRGVEDGLDFAVDMMMQHHLHKGPEGIKEFTRYLDLTVSELRSRRIAWLSRMLPADLFIGKKADPMEGGTE